MQQTWMDTPARYGLVSRIFHWVMAALLMWQFASAILRVIADDTAIQKFFWSTHYTLGFSLFILVILRGLWGLINLRNRPRHDGMHFGRMATLGHAALYLLMFVIPFLALLRAYGRGRGFSPFGFELFAATGQEVPALMAPASALHGLLGWVLLIMIIGHVAMVAIHERAWGDKVLQRMA